MPRLTRHHVAKPWTTVCRLTVPVALVADADVLASLIGPSRGPFSNAMPTDGRVTADVSIQNTLLAPLKTGSAVAWRAVLALAAERRGQPAMDPDVISALHAALVFEPAS